VSDGWEPYPGVPGAGGSSLPPVEPGRVVGLGALCDLGPRHGNGDQSFSVSEFAALEDGRRVILHDDRGFTLGLRPGPGDLREHETLETLSREVSNVVLPDDDDDTEAHPWSWLADLGRARGLDVTARDLRALPYDVVFTESVRRWLASE
jgi:hypothetical protein